jgi:pSer/pThr/pTyr-binding forkhead associated (FHA) protein
MVSGVAAGTEYALEGARTIAGRSEKAAIQIDDGSVSSEHAAFELDPKGFGVRDLASTNGVRVNGKPVLSSALEHGDRIRLGDCELQYVVEDRTRQPTAWSVEEDA